MRPVARKRGMRSHPPWAWRSGRTPLLGGRPRGLECVALPGALQGEQETEQDQAQADHHGEEGWPDQHDQAEHNGDNADDQTTVHIMQLLSGGTPCVRERTTGWA